MKRGEWKRLPIDKDKLCQALEARTPIPQLCRDFNCTKHTLYRRIREFGLTIPKYHHKRRVDGYESYQSPYNHRRVIERAIGRKLAKSEHVHHKNGVRTDNELSNLVLVKDAVEHGKVHGTLQQCGFELYRRGLIQFNDETQEYFIAQWQQSHQ